MKELHTPSEVIDVLGGNAEVARLCSTPDEPCTAKAVSNWRKLGLPAKTYVVLQAALQAKGCIAREDLWTMIPHPFREDSPASAIGEAA